MRPGFAGWQLFAGARLQAYQQGAFFENAG